MTILNLRPELERHLHQRLQAFADGFRQNLVIIGPPGTGKTFQLQQLLVHQPSRLLLIYCPLYRESCRSFLTRLLRSIIHSALVPDGAAGAQGPEGGASGELPDSLLQRLEGVCPRTGAAIQPIPGLISRRLFGEAFNRALDVIPVLMEERGRPCVFILDEFLFLEEVGLVHAFHELGKRVMTWPSALFILSSSSPYRARSILRERLQLLFGQFELLALGTLERKVAHEWVHQELKGVRPGKDIAPFLIEWLGTYPWYLTVFLKRLRERAALARSHQSAEPLFLQTAWDMLGGPEGVLHQWCSSRMERLASLRQGARAIEALIQMAQGVRTTTDIGKRIGRMGLSEALQLLVEQDLAQRNGMCWVIGDPIVRCWLSTVLIEQRSGAGLDSGAVRERVDTYLRSLWSSWVAAQHLSFADQVVGLLSRFADDTVSLDFKTGRLPRFDAITAHQQDLSGTPAYIVADSQGRRWCVTAQESALDENAVAQFEAFCRTQAPKPARKVVITKGGLEQNARLLAKATNMWVWEAEDLNVLLGLYGHA